MYQRWIPIALLAIALLWAGVYPCDRETVAAVQRGAQAAAERHYTAALQAYDAAAQRCPGCPGPPVRQGAIYVAQGRYAEAWVAYLEAIRRGGVDDRALEGMARLYLAQGSAGPAIACLQEVLSRRPGRGDLWLELGQVYLDAGRPGEARTALERALERDIDARQRQSAHQQLALLCLDADAACALEHLALAEGGPDPDVAAYAARLRVALRAVVEGDEPALARAGLGHALLQQGDLASARGQFEAALRLEPAYVDAHAYLGHVLSMLGQDAPAVQHLEQAIALEPTYPLPHYLLGMHDVRKGWVVTGRSYLEQAYDLDPTNPAVCAAIADAHLRAETPMYAVAERWLHAAVDNAPQDPRFHLLLAHFYVDHMIDPGVRGVAVARVAVELAPEDSEAQETLGWAYHLAGRPEEALEAMARARDLAPDEPRIYYRLGEVYRALGQGRLARTAYQQALDLDWNGKIGQWAREAMGE